jgi:ABC-type transport system involved in multi-copper enzyme maturation permease subunit
MLRQIAPIAYYTVLEAVRNRLVWLIVVVALVAVGLSGFLDSLAITESVQIQTALVAALARLAAVFILATFVVTSMTREANDKAVELVLALPLPRAAYLFGKLAGFGLVALLPAVLLGLLMLLFAPPAQVALWSLSLVCELWIAAGFSLLCVLTFKNVMSALSAAMAFYLGARSLASFQLMGLAQASDGRASHKVIASVFDLLSAILPRLDQFTRTDWLVYHTGSVANIPGILIQTVLCISVVAGAALFDIYRKPV